MKQNSHEYETKWNDRFPFLYKAVYYLLYTKLPVVILIYQITKYFQVWHNSTEDWYDSPTVIGVVRIHLQQKLIEILKYNAYGKSNELTWPLFWISPKISSIYQMYYSIYYIIKTRISLIKTKIKLKYAKTHFANKFQIHLGNCTVITL